MNQFNRNTQRSSQESPFEGRIHREPVRLVTPKPVFTKRQLKFIRIFAVAAISILFICGIAIFVIGNRPNRFQAEFFPSAGFKYIFDDFHRGLQAGLANIKFEVSGKGEPIYFFLNEPKTAKDKNYTLETQKGKEFILRLPDSTLVWMNANSTINCPANFSGDTINIFLNGEAYFETAPGSKKYFRVSTPTAVNRQSSNHNLMIETSDGHFTLTGYANDAAIHASLIKGRARILVKGQHSDPVTPIQSGQQASLINGHLSVHPVSDKAEVLALKNGEIYTKNVSIQTIMSRVTRWYDVEVRYASGISENKYTLRVSLGTDISTIIESLKKQGAQISLQGKILTIPGS
jgi:transmembrane sensor